MSEDQVVVKLTRVELAGASSSVKAVIDSAPFPDPPPALKSLDDKLDAAFSAAPQDSIPVEAVRGVLKLLIEASENATGFATKVPLEQARDLLAALLPSEEDDRG